MVRESSAKYCCKYATRDSGVGMVNMGLSPSQMGPNSSLPIGLSLWFLLPSLFSLSPPPSPLLSTLDSRGFDEPIS
jgi:hypothetical protein